MKQDGTMPDSEQKTCESSVLTLPNVVLGASGLRVTGSRTVAGTDQKQHSKPKRFQYVGEVTTFASKPILLVCEFF